MIGKWTLERVAACTEGRLTGDNASFDRVVTDSRKDCRNALFVALQGPRFDAHEHVNEALGKGAVGALVSRDVSEVPHVQVDDTLQALQKLGQANRGAFTGPVVALTGSMGKTTVKEMLRRILGEQTCATEGNLNNHVGVPLSLLQLSPEHQFGVFELGANHEGEIARSVSWVRPDVALVTVVGRAHVGEFGGADAVLRAKSEIFSGLQTGGVAVIPAGQPYTQTLKKRVPEGCRVLTFGLDGEADVRLDITGTDADGYCRAQVLWHGESAGELSLSIPGVHSVYNAAAALAVTAALELDVSEQVCRLNGFAGEAGRLGIRRFGTLTVIDDSYNANPDSMKAALSVLASRHETRKLALLGSMAELGAESDAMHREVLDFASQLSVEVVTVGHWPVSDRSGEQFETSDEAGRWLSAVLKQESEPVVVLIKGSRSVQMEKVVNMLQKTGSPD